MDKPWRAGVGQRWEQVCCSEREKSNEENVLKDASEEERGRGAGVFQQFQVRNGQ